MSFTIYLRLKRLLSLLLPALFLFTVSSFSQPGLPSRTVTVHSTQAINFGSFCLVNNGSSGGTVTVDWMGNRTATGQVMLLNSGPAPQAAIFEINLCQGRLVVINYPVSTILSGNNGGSVKLNIGPTEKGLSGSAFQVNSDCSFITQLRVGGTLIIGSNTANPGGDYSGNFSITFNQQ
jgi:hypothetical protein